MEKEYLPYDNKLIWLYDDVFPSNQPYKIISAFCHKNYNINLHSHDFFELNFITNGTGFHYFNNQKLLVKRGDIFIIPPGSFHGYTCLNNFNVYHLLIHRNFFTRYFTELNMMPSFSVLFKNCFTSKKMQNDVIYIKADENILIEYEEILTEMDQINYNLDINNNAYETEKYLLTYAYANLLIIRLCSEYRKNHTNMETKNNKNDEIDIFNVIKYIEQHITEKITLNDLCNDCYFSKTILTEKFNKIIGLSPMNYVNYYRTVIAKKMLLETDKSITEIAISSGFYDISHFNKMFKKYQLISPSNVRK